MRRHVVGALLAVGALAAVSAPTGAQETDISGQVESTIELSLQQPAPDRVQATVTATVGGTQLSVAEAGRSPRVLRAFRGAIARERVTVRTTKREAGVTEQTITFGPQGP
jgi:predicted secreted protein